MLYKEYLKMNAMTEHKAILKIFGSDKDFLISIANAELRYDDEDKIEEYTLCGVLSSLAEFIEMHFMESRGEYKYCIKDEGDLESYLRLEKIFGIVNEIDKEGDENIKSAVATCFYENIIYQENADYFYGLIPEDIRQWLSDFWGVVFTYGQSK